MPRSDPAPSIATIGVYGFDRDSFLAALAEAGVAYSHLKELAPTTEMRQVQCVEGNPRPATAP